jgi:hypothetical protein
VEAKELKYSQIIPASMRPNEFPAVATQSKLDRDSKEPRCTSRSGTSLAIQRISSAVSLLRLATMKRMLVKIIGFVGNARKELTRTSHVLPVRTKRPLTPCDRSVGCG